MAFLYSPPTYKMYRTIKGSLRYYVDTCTTTYKLAGQWFNTRVPGMGVTDGATWVFNTPTIVDSATAAELQAFGIGTVTTV